MKSNFYVLYYCSASYIDVKIERFIQVTNLNENVYGTYSLRNEQYK